MSERSPKFSNAEAHVLHTVESIIHLWDNTRELVAIKHHLISLEAATEQLLESYTASDLITQDEEDELRVKMRTMLHEHLRKPRAQS